MALHTQRVLFLDRDGVINEKAAPGDYITSWDAFRFCEGIADLLAVAAERGFHNIVITNQQCVGKGLLSQAALESLHRRMIRELASAGARIDRIYYCPHLESDGCTCRKPRPGMLQQAIHDLGDGVDIANSFFVGDTETDMTAGKAVGVNTVLLGKEETLHRQTVAQYVVESLRDVEALL